jgi:Tol biopolymer transport system component
MSFVPSISADGRYVAFVSYASTLVPGDTNGFADIFLADVRTGKIRLIPAAAPGGWRNGDLHDTVMSANARSIMFTGADPLVPGDTNDEVDVFVRDLATATTSMISVAPSGAPGDGPSYWGSISATGRYVVFSSEASNLVPGDTNQSRDVFLRDRAAGTTTRVSLADDERQSTGTNYDPSVSADGRYVVFASDDPTLAPGDGNQAADIFLRDVVLGTTTAISVTPGGRLGDSYSGEPEISPDGRRVTFHSAADDLVTADTNACRDVFVRDLRTGRTTLASVSGTAAQGTADSESPHFSADGEHLVFSSSAGNLVPGDTNDELDVFVRDGHGR